MQDWRIGDDQITVGGTTLPIGYDLVHDGGAHEVCFVECPDCGEAMYGTDADDAERVAREAIAHCEA